MKLIGYALFFNGYATWNGRRVYLDDIMVTEKYRRSGIGLQLFSRVCEVFIYQISLHHKNKLSSTILF